VSGGRQGRFASVRDCAAVLADTARAVCGTAG
jgi:hypothetical protein